MLFSLYLQVEMVQNLIKEIRFKAQKFVEETGRSLKSEQVV